MEVSDASVSIHFNPLLPDIWFAAIIGAGVVLFILASLKARSGLILRTFTFAVFILALLNPSLLEQAREPVKDVAVIVVDQSPSQSMGERETRTAQALEHLQGKLDSKSNLELRIANAPLGQILANETNLFEALDKTLADVPLQRRAGVMFISDGQIHDVPQSPDIIKNYGPVHLLLSGKKNEKDRQLVIEQAPAYGIVGQSVMLKYRIEDTRNIDEEFATVTLSSPGALPQTFVAPVNTELESELQIDHAGQNVFELSVQSVDGEITTSNNKNAVIVNGVRDRLRVLLVSGKPHPGGRSWRDLLTSDPGVDLVHFTILRDPSKLDATPQNELSLIAFPFRELFEVKLYDFDLIIFDRYRLNRILPEAYFDNIVRYVEQGGALLEASGPAFATQDSLYYTGLMNVLPGTPTGEVIEQSFKPKVTDLGQNHPVVQNLARMTDWGQWLRQVVINTEDGDILMKGANEHPLLVLNRIQDGRVAQIASDNLWLWARGYDGGGPHTELLRRVVHWLMKEPELDEKALNVKNSGNTIIVEARKLNAEQTDITMTRPDGSQETLSLKKSKNGLLSVRINAEQLGIYSFEDDEKQKRFTVIGDLNPPELRGVKTTSEIMNPLIESTRGGIMWLDEQSRPNIRMIESGTRFSGRDWLGLRKNNDYVVKSVKSRTLLPEWLSAFLLLLLITFSWWREGRSP